MEAIEVAGVRKSFGDREVLKGVSFRVCRGEVFGLLGPNGAGKTTMIRILAGLLKQDSGQVRVMGSPEPWRVSELLGYLPEERGVYRRARAVEFLRYLGELRGMSREAAEARALELLERLGLLPHARRELGRLSKGMQQKVQLAGAMVHDPQVLLLDEPFSGLDPVNTRQVERLIGELRGEGKAVVLSTHMIERAESLCDRILMLHMGRGVLHGSPEEIRARYGHGRAVIEVAGSIPEVRGARVAERRGGTAVLVVEEGSPGDVLKQLIEAGAEVRRFDSGSAPLHEIFVRVVEDEKGAGGG